MEGKKMSSQALLLGTAIAIILGALLADATQGQGSQQDTQGLAGRTKRGHHPPVNGRQVGHHVKTSGRVRGHHPPKNGRPVGHHKKPTPGRSAVGHHPPGVGHHSGQSQSTGPPSFHPPPSPPPPPPPPTPPPSLLPPSSSSGGQGGLTAPPSNGGPGSGSLPYPCKRPSYPLPAPAESPAESPIPKPLSSRIRRRMLVERAGGEALGYADIKSNGQAGTGKAEEDATDKGAADPPGSAPGGVDTYFFLEDKPGDNGPMAPAYFSSFKGAAPFSGPYPIMLMDGVDKKGGGTGDTPSGAAAAAPPLDWIEENHVPFVDGSPLGQTVYPSETDRAPGASLPSSDLPPIYPGEGGAGEGGGGGGTSNGGSLPPCLGYPGVPDYLVSPEYQGGGGQARAPYSGAPL